MTESGIFLKCETVNRLKHMQRKTGEIESPDQNNVVAKFVFRFLHNIFKLLKKLANTQKKNIQQMEYRITVRNHPKLKMPFCSLLWTLCHALTVHKFIRVSLALFSVILYPALSFSNSVNWKVGLRWILTEMKWVFRISEKVNQRLTNVNCWRRSYGCNSIKPWCSNHQSEPFSRWSSCHWLCSCTTRLPRYVY